MVRPDPASFKNQNPAGNRSATPRAGHMKVQSSYLSRRKKVAAASTDVVVSRGAVPPVMLASVTSVAVAFGIGSIVVLVVALGEEGTPALQERSIGEPETQWLTKTE